MLIFICKFRGLQDGKGGRMKGVGSKRRLFIKERGYEFLVMGKFINGGTQKAWALFDPDILFDSFYADA